MMATLGGRELDVSIVGVVEAPIADTNAEVFTKGSEPPVLEPACGRDSVKRLAAVSSNAN
jgi:hypothetical protein